MGRNKKNYHETTELNNWLHKEERENLTKKRRDLLNNGVKINAQKDSSGSVVLTITALDFI